MYIPCLKEIKETFEHECWNREGKYFAMETEMRMFPQTWGSTALGFDGIGGSAMTSAYTVVCYDWGSNYWGVFFGERLAYIIKDPNDEFHKDMREGQMHPINECGKYLKKEKENE